MNLALAISYAPVDGFPAGSAVAGIQITVVGSAPGNTTPIVQTVSPGTDIVSFPLAVADTYSYSIEGVDAATPPNTFGSPVVGSFAITAPATVTLTLPSSAVASQT